MTLGLLLLSGIILLLLDEHWLVRHAVELVAKLHAPPLVIVLAIVAFGTSAPELVISVGAVLAGYEDIIVGNVIGSPIFNLLGIAGVTAPAPPIDVGAHFIETDIGLLLVISSGVFILALALSRLGRRAGLLLLTAYAAYILQVA